MKAALTANNGLLEKCMLDKQIMQKSINPFILMTTCCPIVMSPILLEEEENTDDGSCDIKLDLIEVRTGNGHFKTLSWPLWNRR